MSADAVAAAAAEPGMFRPRVRFQELAQDHVTFDALTGTDRYEANALGALEQAPVCVFVIGISGAGKSSFVAYVANHLPQSHVALRIPVLGADNPLDVSQMMALTLGEALRAIALDAASQEEIADARADSSAASRAPTGVTGGKLGGSVIPLEVNVEVGSLREEHVENRLAADRIDGMHRLISILRSQGITPVFVMEDTEAAMGADRPPGEVEQFFRGPITAFVQEVDAPCVIAVQRHLVADSPAYERLAPGQTTIDLPRLGGRAAEAIAELLAHRLSQYDVTFGLRDVMADDAVEALAVVYAYANGNLRNVLVVAHDATVRAAEMRSERVRLAHITQAAADFGLRA